MAPESPPRRSHRADAVLRLHDARIRGGCRGARLPARCAPEAHRRALADSRVRPRSCSGVVPLLVRSNRASGGSPGPDAGLAACPGHDLLAGVLANRLAHGDGRRDPRRAGVDGARVRAAGVFGKSCRVSPWPRSRSSSCPPPCPSSTPPPGRNGSTGWRRSRTASSRRTRASVPDRRAVFQQDQWYQQFDGKPRFLISEASPSVMLSRDQAIRFAARDLSDPLTPRILSTEHVRYVVVYDKSYRAGGGAPPPMDPRAFTLLRSFPGVRIFSVHAPIDRSGSSRSRRTDS